MAEQYQLKGISFPFRIGVRGGVEMSVADSTSPQKIVEHYEQILGTAQYERSMEYEVYSQVQDLVFELVEDETLRSVLEYMIKDALNRLEPDAVVNDILIGTVDSEGNAQKNVVVAVINFTIRFTGLTYNTTLSLEKGVT